MTGFLGMDVEAIRGLASQLGSASSDIAQHADALNNALQSAQWQGPDANSFRQDWQSHYANLKNIAQALNDAQGAASRNADQQDQASNS